MIGFYLFIYLFIFIIIIIIVEPMFEGPYWGWEDAGALSGELTGPT